MKIKSILVAVMLVAGVVVVPAANANEKPIVESFTFSPSEIDLSGTSTTVNFELVVSHPSGIDDAPVTVTLRNSRNDNLSIILSRTNLDSKSTKVTFKGSLTVPRDISAGVYSVTTNAIKNNAAAGYQYETETIESLKVRKLLGAESGLLIRSGGNLNLDYQTVVGPSYDPAPGISFNDPTKYLSAVPPIWKVGEIYDPSKYFEQRVASLPFSLSSSSPAVCPSNGKTLSFISEGVCSFIVSTAKTSDYVANSISQTATITSARIKPILSIDKIANQDVKDLGKLIDIGSVYSPSQGWVIPTTATPQVCIITGFFVKLVSGGSCRLSYQTAANSSYLASDIYTVNFEILKDGQPVVVPTPTVSPTPTPTATPTTKPVVKKTITCVKGKKSLKKTAVSPKCPKGYKAKKK
jgi:hypothetical protein